MKITIKHLQPFEVLTRISKFKDKMINLDRIWINKLNNVIIMHGIKMQESGDLFFIKIFIIVNKIIINLFPISNFFIYFLKNPLNKFFKF